MPADTYDPILGFILQGDGNNNNSWGDTFNNSATKPIAQAIGGVNTITAVGGTVDLSTVVPPTGLRLDIAAIQLANGTLTSDLTVKVPNVSKMWWFQNATSGAFNMYVQVPGGASPAGLVQIPQGKHVIVMCDGNGNLFRSDREEVGTAIHHFGTVAPAGALIANGASLVRAEFPDLFNQIGTTWGAVDGTHFTLPLLTDTNRFLRAADGTTLAVGQYQSSQNLNHTHTGSGTTGSENATHTHTGSGTTATDSPDHTHSLNGGASFFVGGATTSFALSGSPGVSGPVSISGVSSGASARHAHTYSFTTSAESVVHQHAFSFTTSGGSADGAEARPNAACVLICIRY